MLWNNPPIANYAGHYPVQDVELAGSKLGPGDPMLISFAAANTDPNLSTRRESSASRAHLAWGAGPHACPAKDPALLIPSGHREPAQQAARRRTGGARGEPDLAAGPVPPGARCAARPLHPGTHREPVIRSLFHAGQSAGNAPGQEAQGRSHKGSWWSGFLTWWKV